MTSEENYGPYLCSLLHTAFWKYGFQAWWTVKWNYLIFSNSKLCFLNFFSLHWNVNIFQISWHTQRKPNHF